MSCEHTFRRIARRLLPLLVVASLWSAAWAEETAPLPQSPPALKFGVLNQQSAIHTAERWNPLLRYLTRKTGVPLQLKMGSTVALTDALMAREEFDLVFTNHNFQSAFDGKYRVLVRWAGGPIHGLLVVREDSPLLTLQDLDGRTVAFPSPDAFVAFAVPAVALQEAGITISEKFAGTQEGALAQLRAGQVDAVAVHSRFLDAYAAREGLRYRILFTSEPFLDLPVLIHPRVPAAQATALRQALLEMQEDMDAQQLLQDTGCGGFEAADENDYDNVRQIYRTIGK